MRMEILLYYQPIGYYSVDNYIDVGLQDTMADLIVNFIGAVVVSFLGYLYLKNQEKHKLAGRFIIHHAI